MKIRTSLIAVLSGYIVSQIFLATPAIATPNPSLWCWSMQSGTVRGTFTMSPATIGDGTATAGTYTLSAFSVTNTAIYGIPLGSTGDGVYEFGGQHPYTIVWNGTQPTSWNRDNGLYTNGIGIFTGPQGNTTEFLMNTNYQSADDYSTSLFFSPVTPALSPANAAGQCPGDMAPTPTPASTDLNYPQSSLAQTGINQTFPGAFIAPAILALGFIALRRSAQLRRIAAQRNKEK